MGDFYCLWASPLITWLTISDLQEGQAVDTRGFENGLMRDGFDEILIRDATPGSVQKEHIHSFDVRVLILEGAFFVATATDRIDCVAGESFDLAAGEPHIDGAGPAGAKLLIGRRYAGR